MLSDPNRPPLGIPDFYGTLENVTLAVAAPGLGSNDVDPDGDGFIVSNFTGPANGTLTSVVTNGAFTYVPAPGFVGTDTFTYLLRDEAGLFSESTTVTIIVGVGAEAPPPDETPPECTIVAVHAGPPIHLDIAVHDAGSGISSIFISKAVNAAVEVPKGSGHFFGEGDVVSLTPPETASMTLSAAKIDEDGTSSVVLEITDAADNVATCDPVVATLAAEVPETFDLESNYPNPFNPSTTIRFQLAEPVHVRLEVFDAVGRRVATLVDGPMAAGSFEATLDASSLPSGTYVYRLQAGSFSESRTMTLLR